MKKTTLLIFCVFIFIRIDAQLENGTKYIVANIRSPKLMSQIDSIVSSTKLANETIVYTLYGGTDEYLNVVSLGKLPHDYKVKKDILDKYKYYTVLFSPSESEIRQYPEINEAIYMPGFQNLDIRKHSEFVIYIHSSDNCNNDSRWMYHNENSHHYFFSQDVGGFIYPTPKRKIIDDWYIYTSQKYPVWIIKYKNGKLTLSHFFIVDRRSSGLKIKLKNGIVLK